MPSTRSHQFPAGRLSGRADPSNGTDPHPVCQHPAGELGEGMGIEDRTVVRTYGDDVPMPVGDQHQRKNLAHDVEGQSRSPPFSAKRSVRSHPTCITSQRRCQLRTRVLCLTHQRKFASAPEFAPRVSSRDATIVLVTGGGLLLTLSLARDPTGCAINGSLLPPWTFITSSAVLRVAA